MAKKHNLILSLPQVKDYPLNIEASQEAQNQDKGSKTRKDENLNLYLIQMHQYEKLLPYLSCEGRTCAGHF